MKILLDNGHGKDTKGKKSPYSLYGVLPSLSFEEWKFNRDIAKRVKLFFDNYGYDCQIVVPETEDISLKERVKRINELCKNNDCILISIHSNACGDGREWNTAQGWSCYTTKGVTKSDKLAECLYNAAEINLKGKKIRYDKSDGDSDWESDFYIIKNSKCPAVLIENFFYTNTEDTVFLLSDGGRQRITDTIVDGILDYVQKN